MRLRTVTMGLLALFGMSTAGYAQRDLTISVNGGWSLFADGSALEGGALVGGDLTYYLSESFGVGAFTDYSFTETDGNLFPLNELDFTDSTSFHQVSQPVELWQYGVHARLRLRGGSAISPYLMLGAGGVTVFLDSQQNGGSDKTTRFAARVGVGATFSVSETLGFQLSVHDSFFPSWDPGRLNPVRSSFQNIRFPDLNPDPGQLDDSSHSIVLQAGVTFTPGR